MALAGPVEGKTWSTRQAPHRAADAPTSAPSCRCNRTRIKERTFSKDHERRAQHSKTRPGAAEARRTRNVNVSSSVVGPTCMSTESENHETLLCQASRLALESQGAAPHEKSNSYCFKLTFTAKRAAYFHTLGNYEMGCTLLGTRFPYPGANHSPLTLTLSFKLPLAVLTCEC
jgi:hypothetical protein